MGKKEANEVRMLGVLPSRGADPIPVGKIPDGGTQVVESGTAQNETVVIHTVDTDKTLYLSVAGLCASNTSEAAGTTHLFVTDGDDTEMYALSYARMPANWCFSDQRCFSPPLEIPTGWKIKVDSSAVDVLGYGFIHGYEA